MCPTMHNRVWDTRPEKNPTFDLVIVSLCLGLPGKSEMKILSYPLLLQPSFGTLVWASSRKTDSLFNVRYVTPARSEYVSQIT